MSIFNHLECRSFIRARLKQMPKKGRGELARISRQLQISPTLLSQIMSQSRQFSPEQSLLLADYFGLNELEREYLLLLVQLEQASSQKLRELLKQKLEKVRGVALQVSQHVRLDRSLTENERVRFYSSWTYSALHLFCSTLPDGISVEDAISRFKLSRARAQEVLRFLAETGLCEEDKGKYRMSTQSTFVEKGSPHLKRHHLNWRIKAMERQDSLEDDELMFTAQVSVSRADFEKVRSLGVEFLKQVTEVVKSSPAEDVANLNLDLFWVK